MGRERKNRPAAKAVRRISAMFKFQRQLLWGSALTILAFSMIFTAACSSTSATTTTSSPAAQTTTNVPATNVPTNTGTGIPQGNNPLRGTSGTVTAISGNTLTLNSIQGQTVSVKYTTATVIQKTVKGSLSDLKTGDTVVITTSQDSSGNSIAKSITTGTAQQFPGGTNFPSNSATPSRPLFSGTPPSGFPSGGMGQFISGTITSTTADSLTIKTADGKTSTVKTDASTGISLSVSGSASDLQVGVFITVGGDTGSDGTVTATSISIQPDGMQLPNK